MARAWPLQKEEALMGWVVILIFAALIMLGLWRFAKMPRAALELLGAALLLGIAGYAWQGSPTLAGRAGSGPRLCPLARTPSNAASERALAPVVSHALDTFGKVRW